MHGTWETNACWEKAIFLLACFYVFSSCATGQSPTFKQKSKHSLLEVNQIILRYPRSMNSIHLFLFSRNIEVELENEGSFRAPPGCSLHTFLVMNVSWGKTFATQAICGLEKRNQEGEEGKEKTERGRESWNRVVLLDLQSCQKYETAIAISHSNWWVRWLHLTDGTVLPCSSSSSSPALPAISLVQSNIGKGNFFIKIHSFLHPEKLANPLLHIDMPNLSLLICFSLALSFLWVHVISAGMHQPDE